jgi:CubicO group peptidase (beta-lactamase class C family)
MSATQDRIQAFIDELVASGDEAGLQVAAWHRGELVVDAWSGVADVRSGRPVDGDTVFVTFSVSKGVTATIAHLLAERGQLDYDAPIADAWPEFAAHGKGAITARHALTHSAGLAHLPFDLQPRDLLDWDGMCAILADSTPTWEPGTKTGYHALTFGWLVGELVRRLDGRPIERILAEDVVAPLGLDSLWFGVPEDAVPRLAHLEYEEAEPAPKPAPDDYAALSVPPGLTPLGAVANGLEIRTAVVPAAGAVANARSLARLYASLVGDGVDGRRLLSRERVAIATTMQTEDEDILVGASWPKALGYFLGSPTAIQTAVSPTAFGHTGAGGFTAYADPDHELAFAMCKTTMRGDVHAETDPARRFERELHALLLS